MKRWISVCVVLFFLTGIYLYAQKVKFAGGRQETVEHNGAREMQEAESTVPETYIDILTDSSIVDAGNHVAAYRIPAEDVDTILTLKEIFKGDYIALCNLDSGGRIYLPDTYGTILGIEAGAQGDITLSYVCGEKGETRQTRIPIAFAPQEADVLDSMYPYNHGRVVAATQELEAGTYPVKVWSEIFFREGKIYAVVFERTSPVYDLQLEQGGLYADYCLTVWNGDGNIISRQTVAGFPVAYEEVYWFTDFSGDGFPDIAVCTDIYWGKESWSSLHTWIWDAESSSYQNKSLPLWGEPTTPAWNEEQSVLVCFHEEGENGYKLLNMFSYVNGQWELIKKWTPLFGKGVLEGESGFPVPDSYKEENYADGKIVGEELIDAEVFWKGDVWNRDGGQYCQLYPQAPEWKTEAMTVGKKIAIGKYVRAEEEKEAQIEDFYGYYKITEFWSTIYYGALEFDALPIQEADMMIGRIIEIRADMLKTYASVRRLGTNGGRPAFLGNYNIETIYIEDPEYQWDAFTPDMAWYENHLTYFGCDDIPQGCRDAIKGCIGIQTTTPFGIQQYYVMDQGNIMNDSLSSQLFCLEKLDEEPAGNNPASYLPEEDREAIIHGLYGTYTIEEFLPTKFYPAKDSSGEIRLPREEADMMVGREIRIEKGNFITYDNFRLPNSVYVDRAMDEFLLEEVNIPAPDYQVTVKRRDEIYGLRDEMLPEDMVQEEYIEINVLPGYYTNSERNLPQMYLLEDGRIIMYGMGEYFLLQRQE